MTSHDFCKKFRWSLETLQVARETNFRCIYCGHSFFASVDAWTQFNVDHLRPGSPGKRDERPENKVAACWTCNKLKSNFDPGKDNENATRAQLIEIAKNFILGVRKRRGERVEAMKKASTMLTD